ncbi:MAG: (4Fe-4S)-binding protein [Bacteroidetes bacterium]|nr:(4Fe-4S)-binding protein [Bacteroidota bacterium]
MEVTKKYTNGEVTVIWKPDICIHSKLCWTELREVFDPFVKPWIKPEGATTERIVAQVKRCPSGALSYYMNNEAGPERVDVDAETIVEASKDGPLLVYGNVTVKNSKGELMKKNNVTAFCRCGASNNKPFCDGTHRKIEFKAD